MKRIASIILALSTIVISSCTRDEWPIFHPGDSRPGGGTEEPQPPAGTEPDWSRLTADNHPRIIFTQEDFDAIKANAGSNPVLKKIHDVIVVTANSKLGAADLVKKLEGKRMLNVSREASLRILSCAYAYKTTGDSKYLEKAEKDMMTVCGGGNFDNWNAKSHFLDAGEMAAAVALGYDWLYKDLKTETRDAVKKSLNDFAFAPAVNKQWNLNFYAATNNWNQVCNGGLVCAALAVYEDNQDVAKGIIEKAIASNVPAMEEMYSPDGNYPEGYSYWNYGTIYEALMLTALETAAGNDAGLSKTEGFSETGKYMLHMEGPTKSCYNYSDCAPSTVICLAQWYFAWKFNDTSVLYHEKDRLGNYSSASEARLMPLVAYYAYKMNLASLDAIRAPEESIFKGAGSTPVVLIHDNWKMDNTDKFLAIKGGKANTSHGHMDAGSFVYDAFGVRWSADLGLQSYGTLEPYIDLWNMNDGSERWTSFRYNNFNHSTITVNNKYHKVAGAAEIKGLVNTDGKKGAVVDMTAPVRDEAASVVRTIYMQGDNLVITDDIAARTDKAAKIRWTMVTKAVPNPDFMGMIELKSASGKYMYMKKSSGTGHNPAWKTWSTRSGNSWDASNTGYYECGYEMTVAAGTAATVTITLTPEM